MSILPRPLKQVLGRLIPFSKEDKIPTFNLGSGTANSDTWLRGDQSWNLLTDDPTLQSELDKLRSSCVLTSSISINGGDAAKFDFTATGYTIDPSTNIRNDISFTGTAITVPDLATQAATFLLIDSSGSLVFQINKPTKDQLSNHLGLWVLVHSNNISINIINSLPINTENVGAQLVQLMDVLGTMREGLEITPGTTTTKISYDEGILFRPGINDLSNFNDKNSIELPQNIDTTFRLRLSDGTETGDLTDLPSTEYESGGVLVLATGVKVLAYPVFIFPSGVLRLQYSQYQYANMQTALVQIQTDAFILEENILQNGTQLGWILIQRNTADWSDPTKYTFVILDRFGQSAVGSSVIPTMQNVYLVSTQPQIDVNDTQGAVQYKNSRAVQDDTTQEWLDSTGAIVASIDGLGNFESTTLKIGASAVTSGIDITPTASSTNLVTSGGVYESLPIFMNEATRDAIGSPAVGLQIFNTDRSRYEYYDSFWGWHPLALTPSAMRDWGVEFIEEFLTSGSPWNWTAAAINAGSSTVGGAFSVARISTGINTNGGYRYTTNPNPFELGVNVFRCESRVLVGTNSDGTDTFQLLVGFLDTFAAVNQVDGLYFLYDSQGVSTGSASSGNWQIVTASNSTRTFTTTAVAIDNANFQKLRIDVNASGTEAKFYIDNVLVGTHTTNIPTGSSRLFGNGIYLQKSAGTTARTTDIDYLYLKTKFTTPR